MKLPISWLAEIKRGLCKHQKRYYKALEWLYSDTHFLEGRTYLLAVSCIERALQKPGRFVPVIDHRQGRDHCKYLMDRVISLVPTNERENFAVDYWECEIMYSPKGKE